MPTASMTTHDSYFHTLAPNRFTPTRHVGGGWNPDEQHIAPAFGLLTHLVDADRRIRGRGDLVIGRVSFDILGALAMEAFEVRVKVIRPGRTIELVEASLAQGGRDSVLARFWLMQAGDTARMAGSAFTPMPPLESLASWEMEETWPGGFVRSVEVRQASPVAGETRSWVRPRVALLEDADVGPVARLMGLVDVANGLCPRVSPAEVAFPNLDLTAHLFREPVGEWIGFDTKVSFGDHGIGATHSVIHDGKGPLALVSQALTVRPNR